MMRFGERLRSLRIEKGITQKQFAILFKVAESTVSMYERSEREPAFEQLERIADYFDVSVDYLMGRTGDRSPSGIRKSEAKDPELADLMAKLEEKGAALQAKTMLRTASKMSKRQLEDVLKVFEMIETDDSDE